jgi:hypothetical protein
LKLAIGKAANANGTRQEGRHSAASRCSFKNLASIALSASALSLHRVQPPRRSMASHSSHYRHKTGISAAEAETLHRVFSQYDLNNDDKISFGELQNKFVAVEKGNM